MKQEQIADILGGARIPVSYKDFPDEQCPQMPYIVFEDIGDDQMYADGIVYAHFIRWEVALLVAGKDEDLELRIETLLNRADLAWTKELAEDEQEQYMQITYRFRTIGGNNNAG